MFAPFRQTQGNCSPSQRPLKVGAHDSAALLPVCHLAAQAAPTIVFRFNQKGAFAPEVQRKFFGIAAVQLLSSRKLL